MASIIQWFIVKVLLPLAMRIIERFTMSHLEKKHPYLRPLVNEVLSLLRMAHKMPVITSEPLREAAFKFNESLFL